MNSIYFYLALATVVISSVASLPKDNILVKHSGQRRQVDDDTDSDEGGECPNFSLCGCCEEPTPYCCPANLLCISGEEPCIFDEIQVLRAAKLGKKDN